VTPAWSTGAVADPTDSYRQTVSLASRILAGSGAGDLIWGHASVRDPGGCGVWIKQAS
jgi:hypothetical protein